MLMGQVLRIPGGKNFGFIQIQGEKKDYFFHRDDFSGHWQDLVHDVNNSKKVIVEFDSEEGLKGPRATNVKRTDYPN